MQTRTLPGRSRTLFQANTNAESVIFLPSFSQFLALRRGGRSRLSPTLERTSSRQWDGDFEFNYPQNGPGTPAVGEAGLCFP